VDQALFLEIADKSGRQGHLSLETAKLSEGFYEQLKRHPIPLEMSAIRPLSNNSAALDCYVWLAYRLHSLSGPKLVTWKALKDQHGLGFSKRPSRMWGVKQPGAGMGVWRATRQRHGLARMCRSSP
jgi:hypothetical protein